MLCSIVCHFSLDRCIVCHCFELRHFINPLVSSIFCSVSIHLCCRWRSNYQRGTVGIQNEPSIASTPLHICGYSKSGPGFVFFCVQWLRDSFINIGIIVGHHCLKLSCHNFQHVNSITYPFRR